MASQKGYNFQDASAISPFLEHPKKGPTSQFCSELAGRLKCYVFAGYPERLTDEEASLSKEESTSEGGNSRKVGANSAVLYGPNGEWVGHYRKTNLFVTDKSWAKPGELDIHSWGGVYLLYDSSIGTGFATFLLPSPLRTLSFGICNDLNISDSDTWTTEDGPYEIANYALSHNANILVLLNAWLDSGKEEVEDTDWYTLNYWAARLRPLWVNNFAGSNTVEIVEEDNENANGKEMIVVVCNRTGEENGDSLFLVPIDTFITVRRRKDICRLLRNI